MLDYDRYWDQVRRDKALMDERDAVRAELDATHAKLDATHAKLDATHAELDATHAKLDATHAKLDAATAERDAAIEKLKQDKIQSARQMKADGMAAETIAKYTGLSTAEIDKLK